MWIQYKHGLSEMLICLKIQDFSAGDIVSHVHHIMVPSNPGQAPYSFKNTQDWIVMTHVVTESCIQCRYTDCVDVCPVDCFREGPNFLTIDPDECIDCAVCVAECPVNAIFAEEDVPADQQQFIKINVELARNWPSITKTKAPLPDADQWKDTKEKLQLLKR
jgi:ferredoxin